MNKIKKIDLNEVENIFNEKDVAFINKDYIEDYIVLVKAIYDSNIYKNLKVGINKYNERLFWLNDESKKDKIKVLRLGITEFHQKPSAYICNEDLIWVIMYDPKEKLFFWSNYYIK